MSINAGTKNFEIKVILAERGYRGEVIESIKAKFGYVFQVVISVYKEEGFIRFSRENGQNISYKIIIEENLNGLLHKYYY